jgi:nucleotide-binding universal stress UspA family protein
MPNRILVAVDLSAGSLDALREAHARAAGTGALLAVSHVLPNLYNLHTLFPQDNQAGMLGLAELERRVRGLLDENVRAIVGAQEVAVFVEQGVDYAEVIRRAQAWSADLLVVGSQGHSGLPQLVLGSVAERVVRYAHCPVLVVRSGPERKLDARHCVLVATDLSDPSLPAVSAGVSEAQRLGARLVLAHSLDLSGSAWGAALGNLFGAVSVVPPEGVQRDMRDALRATLQQSLDQLHATGEVTVLDGPPATSIVRYAEELQAGLIVVGTHGRTGLSRIALGSVADRIVRTAGCSVLAVRLANN